MKFLKRIASGGGLHPQHQSLYSDEDDDESLQRKPSQDSQTNSSTSTPIASTRELSGLSVALGSTTLEPEESSEKKQLESSFLSNASSNVNDASGKEPVWKRRVRANQAALPHETRSTSTSQTPGLLNQTTAGSEDTEANQIDSIQTQVKGIRIEPDERAVESQDNVEEQVDLADDELGNFGTSQQTYSHELEDVSDNFFPSIPVQDNSILHTTNDETFRKETDSVEWEERNSSRTTSGLMEKMMSTSFRKSVMASKNKAWKTVLACHGPSSQKVGRQQEEGTKIDSNADLPFWKRLESNLFASSNEPQDGETSFESTSTSGSGELLTFLKRAGTSLTGFVKETTAACSQPQHEEDDGVSFDDHSSNGSTLDSRTVGESKASTNHNDSRRLWQEFFEDDNENFSLGDEATNPGSMGGCQTVPDRLKNAVSMS